MGLLWGYLESHSALFSVYSDKILKLATNFSRDKLISVGTCFGKFTKTKKFRLHITALDFLAPYAKVCIFVQNKATTTPPLEWCLHITAASYWIICRRYICVVAITFFEC